MLSKRNIIKEIFIFLSATVLVSGSMELLWPRLVIAYLDFDILLIFWLLAGIFTIVSDDTVNDEKNGSKQG